MQLDGCKNLFSGDGQLVAADGTGPASSHVLGALPKDVSVARLAGAHLELKLGGAILRSPV